MVSLADKLLVGLYVVGHTAPMVAVCNRRLVRLRDSPAKAALMVAHAAAWPAVAVVSALWIGLDGFAESFLLRAPWPQKLLAPWQWAVCTWPLAWVAAEWARRRPAPAELLARHTWVRSVDMPGGRGRARLPRCADLRRLEVCELTLAPVAAPADLDGLRIAHLSDLHYDGGGRSEAVMAVVRDEVARASPDLIVVTGDIIPHAGSVEEAARATGALRAPWGTYAVLGNHDFWVDASQVQEALERRGVRVLRNEGVPIKRGEARLWLAGVDDHWSGCADVRAGLRGRRPDDLCVLLAHNPDTVMEAARHGIHLQLSGHTHGGQVVLPVVGPILTPSEHGPRFAEGLHKVDGSLLWVSRGQSVHVPIRVGSTPQVTLITLRAPRQVAGPQTAK